MADGIICDANSLIIAAQETGLLVSLEPELQVALGQGQPRLCSQEESLVYFQNQVG